ncbi:MAG: hypothetical protein ACXVP0_10855 [Bacteroidia bacterium]
MRLLILLLPVVILSGCYKDKYKASSAFFIQPKSVQVLTTNTGGTLQGTSSNKITDLWLYVNDNFKGVYPVGNSLPVVSTGLTHIFVYPGIKNNGISATRQPYEFYERIELDTIVTPATTVLRNFNFRYKPNTVFKWVEGFEGYGGVTGISMQNSSSSSANFTILDKKVNASVDVFEGDECMYFYLDADHKYGQFESISTYPLPANGAPVYVEINYKCNQPFQVGVFNGYDYRPMETVNTSPNWNKIYIQVSLGVSSPPVYNKYGVFFKAILADGVSKAEIYIDNIKLVSY